MGSGLCPGATKDIIQQLSQIQKGEKSYQMFFRVCLGMSQMYNDERSIEHISDLNLNIKIQDQQNEEQLFKEDEQDHSHSCNDPKQQRILQQNEKVNLLFEDGTRYIGRIENGLPHGQGEEYLASGEQYRGRFQFGVKDGLGECRFANSQRYEGQFRQNMMWGKGKYTFANGDCYIGEFQRNQRSGRGQYILGKPTSDGLSQFQGLYKGDLKEGHGKLSFKSENIDGQWKRGLFQFILSNDLIR